METGLENIDWNTPRKQWNVYDAIRYSFDFLRNPPLPIRIQFLRRFMKSVCYLNHMQDSIVDQVITLKTTIIENIGVNDFLLKHNTGSDSAMTVLENLTFDQLINFKYNSDSYSLMILLIVGKYMVEHRLLEIMILWEPE
jgi:hypothetical protein